MATAARGSFWLIYKDAPTSQVRPEPVDSGLLEAANKMPWSDDQK